jgi:HEAT repeat protein
MMDDPNHPAFLQAVHGFEVLAEEADVELLDKHAARLHRLAHGANADARVAAVKGLARTRNLDNVPTLIYALSDPDARVATAANDGLVALSRKTRGTGGLGESGSEQRADTIARWKQWYFVIRPDAELDD